MTNKSPLISVHLIGLDELKKRAAGFVGLGILLVALGVLALTWAMAFTIASVLFFGFLMIVGGVLQVVHSLLSRSWGGHFLDLLIGLLNVSVGLMIVGNPGAAAVALTLLIALFLILGGVFRVALAATIPFHHVGWLLLHGVISLLLGVLILQQWPLSGLQVIGLFIGIDMLFNGWTLIMLGMVARRLPSE